MIILLTGDAPNLHFQYKNGAIKERDGYIWKAKWRKTEMVVTAPQIHS